MEVTISIAGGERTRDLAQLRDWLGSAGGQVPWRLVPEPAPSGESLGVGVDEICAIVTAATQLPLLVDRVREWFPTRHYPKQIQLTITLDPAAPEHHEESDHANECTA